MVEITDFIWDLIKYEINWKYIPINLFALFFNS